MCLFINWGADIKNSNGLVLSCRAAAKGAPQAQGTEQSCAAPLYCIVLYFKRSLICT